MFKELLNFNEVCFKSAVVEEERRVCPRGQVFELSWLPGEDTHRRNQGQHFNSVIKHVNAEAKVTVEAQIVVFLEVGISRKRCLKSQPKWATKEQGVPQGPRLFGRN